MLNLEQAQKNLVDNFDTVIDNLSKPLERVNSLELAKAYILSLGRLERSLVVSNEVLPVLTNIVQAWLEDKGQAYIDLNRQCPDYLGYETITGLTPAIVHNEKIRLEIQAGRVFKSS